MNPASTSVWWYEETLLSPSQRGEPQHHHVPAILTWYIFAPTDIVHWEYSVIVTKIAVMRDSMKTLTCSDNSREQPSSPSPSPPEVTRTQSSSSKQIRGVRPILNSKNIIPHCLPTCFTMKGVEKYVSMSLSDPAYHIHTVSIFESENWSKYVNRQ